MSKRKYVGEWTGAPEVEVGASPPEALPIGLKEEVLEGEDGASERAAMEAAIKDTWQPREDGLWINSRDFITKDGAVPQGVVRTLEEAYALEVQKRG